MAKLYNIGVTQSETDGPNANLGFIVSASNADEAYRLVCEVCDAGDIQLQAGHMAQRRDPNGGNEYFDRTFPLFHRID